MEDRKEVLVEEKSLRQGTHKPYSTPELIVHGSVEGITQAGTGPWSDTTSIGSH